VPAHNIRVSDYLQSLLSSSYHRHLIHFSAVFYGITVAVLQYCYCHFISHNILPSCE